MSSRKLVKTFSSALAVWAYIAAAVKTITENVFLPLRGKRLHRNENACCKRLQGTSVCCFMYLCIMKTLSAAAAMKTVSLLLLLYGKKEWKRFHPGGSAPGQTENGNKQTDDVLDKIERVWYNGRRKHFRLTRRKRADGRKKADGKIP